ncbi:hypothetical protein [Anaerosalibacter sp. Marseille-P3206]|uniref:hypothetical protein n=1 Tax=Anaerosalibacter sp. Marseille-P3206 TaxID=1871005 RepID=UPI0009852EF5|nr:hypothetical protein [Anaerosalibacter sp. Marseille-P3206]
MKRNVYDFYILLGVGIGIIVTSLFFFLKPNVKYKEYTNEEIIEKATELGMVTIKESLNTNRKENIEKEETQTKTQKEIKFTVNSGQPLVEIANNLFKSGIIEDKEEFIQFVKDNNMDKRLLPGDYVLKSNLSYTTIMKILSSKK